MELMDTSLDKFYKNVIEKGKTIPEDILGKIAVAVRPAFFFFFCFSVFVVCNYSLVNTTLYHHGDKARQLNLWEVAVR